MKTPKKTHETPALTLYVVFSILILIIYTIVEQTLSVSTGITRDTLTTAIFGVFGGEMLSCALIKIFKLRGDSHGDCDNYSGDFNLSDNSVHFGGEER